MASDAATEPLLARDSAEVASEPATARSLPGANSGTPAEAKAVTRWLLEAQEDIVVQALREVGRNKGYLIMKVAEKLGVDSDDGAESIEDAVPDPPDLSSRARQDSTISTTSRASRSPIRGYRGAEHVRRDGSLHGSLHSPVVLFASQSYFCNEDDDVLHLDVLRIGDCTYRSEVDYFTRDLTAKANVKYVPAAGRLAFAPGQTHYSLTVQLIADDDWAPLQDFEMELVVDGSINACMEFGRTTTVRVIDKDVFPSYKYQAEIEKNGALDVDNTSIMMEYFKLNLSQSNVCFATMKMLMVEQFRNLIFVVGLFAQVFLLDYVLVDESEDHLESSGFEWLLCVVAWQIVSFAWLHFCDYRSISWGTAGMSRLILQSALLRTYLHKDDNSSDAVRRGDLEMAVNVMVPELVQSGYMNIVGIASKVGKLFMLLLFQVLSPPVFKKPFRPTGITASVVFPLILLGFFYRRRRKIEEALQTEQTCRRNLFEHVEQSSEHCQMIFGFGCQAVFVERFEGAIKAYNRSVIERLQVSTNNVYYAKWLATVTVGFYTCLGGWQILHGYLSTGIFLANAAAIHTMGEIWDGIYTSLLEVAMATPALKFTTKLMNLPTDARQRMAFQQSCSRRTIELMSEKETGLSPVELDIPDRLPLQVRQTNGSIVEFAQGTLTAVVGQSGSGKAALLRVLGGVRFPGSFTLDKFFIPSHLRLVHIDATPLLFRGTLLENLTFGCQSSIKADAADLLNRSVKVCRRLGVPERLLTSEKLTQEAANWTEALCQNECQLLSLARGIIANPHVLVLHLPAMLFDNATANRVLRLLREFVDLKGVEEDPLMFSLRRPRTCIFSAARMHGTGIADHLVFCQRGALTEVREGEEAWEAPELLNAARRISKSSFVDTDSSFLEGSAL